MGKKAQILLVIFAMMLAAMPASTAERVRAEDYHAFWIWSGVRPHPVLGQAMTLYLHKGEIVTSPGGGRFKPVGPPPLRFGGQHLWLTVRVETLALSEPLLTKLVTLPHIWEATGGSRVRGLQIDFDAATHRLADYDVFLRQVRTRLDRRYQLGVTGLLDWAKTGSIQVLNTLPIDEIVVQTYQGRATVPEYARYLPALSGLNIPFKVGLVQGGDWDKGWESVLRRSAWYQGEVVFMVGK